MVWLTLRLSSFFVGYAFMVPLYSKYISRVYAFPFLSPSCVLSCSSFRFSSPQKRAEVRDEGAAPSRRLDVARRTSFIRLPQEGSKEAKLQRREER